LIGDARNAPNANSEIGDLAAFESAKAVPLSDIGDAANEVVLREHMPFAARD
jgi:hypothetical protein